MGTEEYLLQKAYKEGWEKNQSTFIKNLLTGTDLNDEKIAFLADVNITLVKQIKAKLAQG